MFKLHPRLCVGLVSVADRVWEGRVSQVTTAHDVSCNAEHGDAVGRFYYGAADDECDGCGARGMLVVPPSIIEGDVAVCVRCAEESVMLMWMIVNRLEGRAWRHGIRR